tara:strand:+ start:553 stop:714 length:162 start_codon:yes stop_codon:yes gene_type:complete
MKKKKAKKVKIITEDIGYELQMGFKCSETTNYYLKTKNEKPPKTYTFNGQIYL